MCSCLHAVILCPELTAPDNGTVVYNTISQLLGVGTTATYSCDPGYILVGETTRTCQDANTGEIGVWNSTAPICEGIATVRAGAMP